MKKVIYTFLSYLSAFNLGVYCYATTHGNTPEVYRWILTILFGIFFFIGSRQKMNDELESRKTTEG